MMLIGILIAYFNEAFFMTGAGLGVLGIRLKLKTMAFIALLYTGILYLVRYIYAAYNIPLGTHSLIVFTSFALMLIYIAKQRILDSIIATLINAALILVGEGFFLIPLLKFFNLDPNTLVGNPIALVFAGLLSSIPLIIFFTIGRVLKVTILNLKKFNLNQ